MNINNSSLNRSKKIPSADEINVNSSNIPYYSTRNNILFTRYSSQIFVDSPLSEPKFVKISELKLPKKIIQPDVDINSGLTKIPFLASSEVKKLYHPKKSDIALSLIFHLIIISTYYTSIYIIKPDISKFQVLEVSFGLVDTPSQTLLRTNIPNNEGQLEATKAKTELPQLPKTVVPDTVEKIEQKTAKEVIGKQNNQIVINEHKKITKLIPEKKIKETIKTEEKKLIGPKPPEHLQKIKDFAERKEKDLRKVDEKTQAGIHNKDKLIPPGKKFDTNKLPDSPLPNSNSLPNDPISQTPTGDINGNFNAANFNKYRALIARQLKLNWNTSAGTVYSVNLKTVVEFTVNEFGYLIGTTKILTSSGNKKFDDYVLNTLKGTFPVTPPPKNINPPNTFQATYSAKDVQ